LFSSQTGKFLIALPIDGLDAARLHAFEHLAQPAKPRLVVTTRRARALGIESNGPVALTLPQVGGAEAILSLAEDARSDEPAEVDGSTDGSAAAAIELAKIAQRLPALLIAEVDAPSSVLIEPPLVVVPADAVMKFGRADLHSLEIASEANVPLAGGISTRFVVFRDSIGGGSVAVIVGKPDMGKPVPVRLHSSCLTGDVFGSSRCDCGDQLRLATKRLNEEGGGIILYLEQEGRGLGLANKMRAYALQDDGLDTVDANTTLGFDDDERDYGVAARMLQKLGCSRVYLMTNNPAKLDGLSGLGIDVVGRVPLHAPINAHNRRYMTAKAMRAGHKLDHLMAALAEAGEVQGAVRAAEEVR
jgi:GTP cyclohydrolase II